MKLTRVIMLALAFAIPFASTTLANAGEEKAAVESDKPAKKKKKKHHKKAKKAAEESGEAGEGMK